MFTHLFFLHFRHQILRKNCQQQISLFSLTTHTTPQKSMLVSIKIFFDVILFTFLWFLSQFFHVHLNSVAIRIRSSHCSITYFSDFSTLFIMVSTTGTTTTTEERKKNKTTTQRTKTEKSIMANVYRWLHCFRHNGGPFDIRDFVGKCFFLFDARLTALFRYQLSWSSMRDRIRTNSFNSKRNTEIVFQSTNVSFLRSVYFSFSLFVERTENRYGRSRGPFTFTSLRLHCDKKCQ